MTDKTPETPVYDVTWHRAGANPDGTPEEEWEEFTDRSAAYARAEEVGGSVTLRGVTGYSDIPPFGDE